MEKETGWLPVHDTAAVWRKLWREFESHENPGPVDYHIRRGTYARGVLWSHLGDNAMHASKLYTAQMAQMHRLPLVQKEWWKK